MKIICACHNYFSECRKEKEEGKPCLFFKPDIALLKDGKPFYHPDFSKDVRCGIEIVARVCKLGKSIPERFSYRYYDELTVGANLFAEDILEERAEKNYPADLGRSFESSAIIGNYVTIKENRPDLKSFSFRMEINGETVQEGNSRDRIFGTDEIISYASEFFTMKIGDLIYTGMPGEGVRLKIGDLVEGFLNDKKLLEFEVK